MDITAVTPSCNRPELLEQTIRTLAPHCLRYGIRWLIAENCACFRGIKVVVDRVRREHPQLDIELLDMVPGEGAEPSEKKMAMTVDYLYDLVESDYIFHCEDDWRFSESDFMASSLAVLEQFPEVSIVRLTGREERPFPDPDHCYSFSLNGRTERVHFSRYGGLGGAYGGFTYHAGLRRRSDYIRHYRPYAQFKDEIKISRYAQSLGHRNAILEKCYAWHAGKPQSTLGHTFGQK